ncbi:hypothetical protein AAFF_G00114470 [Aldrovandia affinis]|uniref:Uncharacterized protein n=1 Tax=Aldrovandia affinis TaxID=143900 RepID=A0AAD7WAB1_9TELE|nr:hypothetical protein AAFF_G00114470 [Aldrovandia affinis]
MGLQGSHHCQRVWSQLDLEPLPSPRQHIPTRTTTDPLTRSCDRSSLSETRTTDLLSLEPVHPNHSHNQNHCDVLQPVQPNHSHNQNHCDVLQPVQPKQNQNQSALLELVQPNCTQKAAALLEPVQRHWARSSPDLLDPAPLRWTGVLFSQLQTGAEARLPVVQRQPGLSAFKRTQHLAMGQESPSRRKGKPVLLAMRSFPLPHPAGPD